MLKFIVRRSLLSILILLLAVGLLFFMIHMVPGDPSSVILGPKASPELKAELNARMGLDKPILVQLGNFYSGLARGDMGIDVFSERQVADVVFEQLPYTLALVFAAIGGATLLGIPLGCFSAIRQVLTATLLTSYGTLCCRRPPWGLAGLVILRAWFAPPCWR